MLLLRAAPRLSWARRAGTHNSCQSRAVVPSLFGLAPCGVYHASDVTVGAVRSYRTFSPLPATAFTAAGGIFSVALAVSQP